MGEARRRKLADTSAPVAARKPPTLFARVAPFVFAWCPTCNGRHLTLITAFPVSEPLTDVQTQKVLAVVAEYLGDVASMCAEHRRDLRVKHRLGGTTPRQMRSGIREMPPGYALAPLQLLAGRCADPRRTPSHGADHPAWR